MSGICLRLNTCKNVFDSQAENSELQHLKVFQKNTEGLIEVEPILNDWFNERIEIIEVRDYRECVCKVMLRYRIVQGE